MLAQGNQRVVSVGPIASLNSLVEAPPAKPRQLFAAAFRPKGHRTLSQSTLRPILSRAQSYHRAGRAGKPISNSTRTTVTPTNRRLHPTTMGGSCFQTASYIFRGALAGRVARYVGYVRSVERPAPHINGLPSR